MLESRYDLGDIRPNDFRHRIDTPSRRGVNVQRRFGSQRAARFQGDPVPCCTDNTMHDRRAERFCDARKIEGLTASATG